MSAPSLSSPPPSAVRSRPTAPSASAAAVWDFASGTRSELLRMIAAHPPLGVAVRAWYRDVRRKVFTTTHAARADLLRAVTRAAARDFRLYSHAVGWMRVYHRKIPAAPPQAARVVEWAHQSAIDDGSERRLSESLETASLAEILRGFPRGMTQQLETYHGIRTPRVLRDADARWHVITEKCGLRRRDLHLLGWRLGLSLGEVERRFHQTRERDAWRASQLNAWLPYLTVGAHVRLRIDLQPKPPETRTATVTRVETWRPADDGAACVYVRVDPCVVSAPPTHSTDDGPRAASPSLPHSSLTDAPTTAHLVDATSSASSSSTTLSPTPLPPPLELRFRFRFVRGPSRCVWRLDKGADATVHDDDEDDGEEKDDVREATGDGDGATPDLDNCKEAAAAAQAEEEEEEAAADEKVRLRKERRDAHRQRVRAQLGVSRETTNWVEITRPPAMVSDLVRAMNAHIGQPVGDDETFAFSGAYGWGPSLRPYSSGSRIRVSGRVASVGDRSKPGTLNFGSGNTLGCTERPDVTVVVVRDQITGAFRTFYIDADNFRGGVDDGGAADCTSLGHVFDDAKRSVGLLSLAITDATRIEAMRDAFGWWRHIAVFGEAATIDTTDRPFAHPIATVPGVLALVEAYVF